MAGLDLLNAGLAQHALELLGRSGIESSGSATLFKYLHQLCQLGSVRIRDDGDLCEFDNAAGFGDTDEFLDDKGPVLGGISHNQEALVDKVKGVVLEGETLEDIDDLEAAVARANLGGPDSRDVDSCKVGLCVLCRHFCCRR